MPETITPEGLLRTLDARLAHYTAKDGDPNIETTVLEDMLYAVLVEARPYVVDQIPVLGETPTERAAREAENTILTALVAHRNSRKTATTIEHATQALRAAEEARSGSIWERNQGVRIPPIEEPDKHPALQGEHTRSINTPDLLRELEAIAYRLREIYQQLDANLED